MWRALHSREERRQLFDATGNRFTALHRIPGWHTSTSSPIDSMHLLYLGAMNWIVKQVLVGPGILNKRRPGDREPQDIFNDCLNTMWMPKNFQRLPPKVRSTNKLIPIHDDMPVRAHICTITILRTYSCSLAKHEDRSRQINGNLRLESFIFLSF